MHWPGLLVVVLLAFLSLSAVPLGISRAHLGPLKPPLQACHRPIIMLALPWLRTRPVHRSRSGECVRNISVSCQQLETQMYRQCAVWVDERSGAVRTRAHELVSVLSDCHQRGHADQTEQLIPAIQKEILQAARANAVLCKDCKGEGWCRKFHRKHPGTAGEVWVLGPHLGKTFHSESCFFQSFIIL